MIENDRELQGILNRIERFRKQILHLREVETNLTAYELSAGGFLAEIARMNLEVSEYLSVHPIRFEQEREKIAA